MLAASLTTGVTLRYAAQGGSYIAQQFALDHPERTVAPVLMGAFRAFAAPELFEFRAELEQIEDPVPEQLARDFQESTIERPLGPGLLELLLVYQGTGHAVHWEEPARAAADIAAFASPRGPLRPRLAAVR